MKVLRRIVIIVLIIAAGALIGKFIVSFKKEPEEVAQEDFQRIVSVDTIKLNNYTATVEMLGKVVSINKIDIFSEVSGVLQNGEFDEGNTFKKGDILLQVDAGEFSQSLKAQKGELITQVAKLLADIKIDFPNEFSRWELFLNDLSVDKELVKLPKIEDEKFKRFIAGRGILTVYYNIESAEQRLSKYQVRAPFDGVVTESLIKKGSLIRVGQKIGEFLSLGSFEFVSEVSLSDLNYIKMGTVVKLSSDESKMSWTGKVYKINSKIDPSTQRVKIYVKIQGDGIKDGMYLKGQTQGFEIINAFTIDRQQVNGNVIYVVKDGVLVEKEITVEYTDEKYAYITGVENGELVLVSNLKGLYNGMKVKVVKK